MSVFSSLRSSLASLHSSILPAQEEPGLWRPTRRTHLLHLGVAVFLFVFAYFFTELPREPVAIGLTALACISLPIASVVPIVGVLLGLVVTWLGLAVPQDTGLVASRVIWALVALLLSRGGPRHVVYPISAFVVLLVVYYGGKQGDWLGDLVLPMAIGVPCLVFGEVIRRQRDHVRETASRRRQALNRQRRLIASELHDTVASDLSYAVMTAEQLKVSRPDDGDLARDLDAVIEPVRTAVHQLRRSLQTMTATDGDDVSVLLPAASPRPISQVLSDARRVLAERRASIEEEGAELLEESVLTPGTRQQVLRVINELVNNAVKYTSSGGRVRITVRVDDSGLECMVTNPVDVSRSKDAVLSSGIGLEGARRRVETLGGELVTNQGGGRWTVAFTAPARRLPRPVMG
ncbi:sensor histidine kinase [Actinomyces ruminicola]|uniref:sensor histidine kinase n=1 Tax=Actinomyces ruminicola TaxID=332524 RepID=UPI0011CB8072|nr:histidine kinase [Actinomyces ruminicola]